MKNRHYFGCSSITVQVKPLASDWLLLLSKTPCRVEKFLLLTIRSAFTAPSKSNGTTRPMVFDDVGSLYTSHFGFVIRR